jgi:integrase
MLTDTKIRNLKPGSKPVKVSDGGGLHLLIQPSGSKLWRMAYRFQGKQRTLAFGSYPAVTLTAARDRRDDSKRQIRAGEDPGRIIKAEKQAVIAAKTSTFSAVADEWLERKVIKEKKSESTISRARWLIRILSDAIGDRQLSEIEAPELLDALRKVEADGRHETVARLRAIASQIFRYGIATGRCKRDPASDLRGATTAPVSTPHAAIIDPAGIGKLLRGIDSYEHSTVMRLALRLLALVFVRPSELRFAEWREIDATAAVWSIPAQRMKMRSPHRNPLARQAMEVLNELRSISGDGKYLFPSRVKADRPISENALNDALRRMGYAHDEMTAHGFRAMASTTLNEMNRWPVDVIERQLAHQERNAVRRVYNRATHWPERVAMMQAWADHLDELRALGKVVEMPKQASRRNSGA